MLTVRDIYKLQSDYGVAEKNFSDSQITFDEYLKQCRVFVFNNMDDEYIKGGWEAEKKQQYITNLVSKFVDLHKVKVKGYVTPEGVIDLDLLLEDLIEAVTGVSVLKEALEDPEVDEIQINDKDTIFVARNGVLEPYVDKRGRVMRFASNDEIITVLNKLIDDGTGNKPQFTDGNPILNAKTAKHQYRINAVHPVLNTMDKPPNNFPITSVVIRKFKEVKLTIGDLIKYGAVTEKMGRFLMLLGRAGLKVFCVGPTGSGKTTLLNIIANTIPINKRIILVQNPTEISFFDRDEYGRNKRNVVHWEVFNDITMDMLITNTLRQTPEIIIVGEMREKEEFFQAMRAMRTGHPLMGTFHAEDSSDAIDRFAIEFSSAAGMSQSEAEKQVAKSVEIIISQHRFENGKRRVMEITEVLGYKDGEVLLNPLFKFDLTGEVVIDEKTGLPDSIGEFKQVGVISDDLIKKFYKAGVSRKEIEDFLIIK